MDEWTYVTWLIGLERHTLSTSPGEFEFERNLNLILLARQAKFNFTIIRQILHHIITWNEMNRALGHLCAHIG